MESVYNLVQRCNWKFGALERHRLQELRWLYRRRSVDGPPLLSVPERRSRYQTDIDVIRSRLGRSIVLGFFGDQNDLLSAWHVTYLSRLNPLRVRTV